MSRAPTFSSQASDHSEGTLAKMIEEQTAKVPSDVFLWAALGSMGLSLTMSLTGRQQTANFIGQWVPTLLIFGIYNKIVKIGGHDQLS
jgi:hypothetical protein